MRIPLLCLLLALPAPLSAQALPTPRPPVDLGDHAVPRLSQPWLPGLLSDTRDTPTTRRQRIVWISRLKAQAEALQAQDGGTLSAVHRAYIQRRLSRYLRS